MKSKTSFFNGTVIQKNATRFAPIWALYGVMWLLILVTMLDSDGSGYWFASSWVNSLQAMPVLNCIYAFICAQMLFGDLYNSRMCNSLHALPLRREGWFVTHVLSGIGFSLVPNLVVMVLSLLFLEGWWAIAPLWLLGVTLQFIFFFGAAVLSAYCVGNRFAMLLVYGLLNGLSLLLLAMLECLYLPMLYGIVLDTEPFVRWCPLLWLCNSGYLEVDKMTYAVTLTDGWGYLLLCALVGVVFMGLGLLLYRKRNLECAGDFLAVGWLSPVFLVLYCLCAGMAGYLFFSLFVGEETLFFLVVGLLLGWFTGKMLLERSLRVFGKKSWLGCAALVLVFLLSLGVTKLDLFGIVRWQPAPESIRSATVWVDGTEKAAHTDAATLQSILEIHSYGIENPRANYNGEPDVDIHLEYKLKNGTSASRSYTVDLNSSAGELVQKLLSHPEYVLGTGDTAALKEKLILVTTWDGFVITDTDGLFAALEVDCQLGTTAQHWSFHRDEEHFTYVELEYWDAEGRRQHWSVNIYESCVNTIEWLTQQGYVPMK